MPQASLNTTPLVEGFCSRDHFYEELTPIFLRAWLKGYSFTIYHIPEENERENISAKHFIIVCVIRAYPPNNHQVPLAPTALATQNAGNNQNMAILGVKIEPRFPNFLDKRERTVNKVLEWVGASGLTQFLPFSPKLRPEMAGFILPFVDVVRENVVPKFANDILVRLSWFSGVTSPVIPDDVLISVK